jgi:hypothetical protein
MLCLDRQSRPLEKKIEIENKIEGQEKTIFLIKLLFNFSEIFFGTRFQFLHNFTVHENKP